MSFSVFPERSGIQPHSLQVSRGRVFAEELQDLLLPGLAECHAAGVDGPGQIVMLDALRAQRRLRDVGLNPHPDCCPGRPSAKDASIVVVVAFVIDLASR